MKTKPEELTVGDMKSIFIPSCCDGWVKRHVTNCEYDYTFRIEGLTLYSHCDAYEPLTNQQATNIVKHFKKLGYTCTKKFQSRKLGWQILFKRG